MRNKRVKFSFVFIFLSMIALAKSDFKKMEIGDKAVLTDNKIKDVSGKIISIDDVKKKNGVVVIFSCNTCPFVLRWEGRYPEIKKRADKNEIGMLILNSNHQKRDGDESYEAMQKHASEKNYNFYYALDEDSRIANAFGGQTTPHAFLFDSNMKLVYKGAIDDNYKSADEVKTAFLIDAIKYVGEGKSVNLNETQPVGCSIKRKLD